MCNDEELNGVICSLNANIYVYVHEDLHEIYLLNVKAAATGAPLATAKQVTFATPAVATAIPPIAKAAKKATVALPAAVLLAAGSVLIAASPTTVAPPEIASMLAEIAAHTEKMYLSLQRVHKLQLQLFRRQPD